MSSENCFTYSNHLNREWRDKFSNLILRFAVMSIIIMASAGSIITCVPEQTKDSRVRIVKTGIISHFWPSMKNEFQWTCLQLLSNSSRHPVFSQVQKNFEASFSFHLFVLGCFFHWRKCVPWESLTSLEVLNSAATLCIITRHKRVWTHFLQAAKMFTNGSA